MNDLLSHGRLVWKAGLGFLSSGKGAVAVLLIYKFIVDHADEQRGDLLELYSFSERTLSRTECDTGSLFKDLVTLMM